jgi:hypothetical protein
MNKHEEIRNDLYLLEITCDMQLFEEKRKNISTYIREMEQLEMTTLANLRYVLEYTNKAYEEEKAKRKKLEKDVKRYFELDKLDPFSLTKNEDIEWGNLNEKLSKVGNE